MVVLDSSKSMGQTTYRIAKQIVKIIFTATGVSHRGVHVGLIIVGKYGRVVFDLKKCKSVVSMTQRVKKVQLGPFGDIISYY